MDKARLAGALLATAWIIYELVMAWILRDQFTLRDWAALAGKLAYLSGLLAASLRGAEGFLNYAAIMGSKMASIVRATQGWLAYTWFTVVVPGLGLAASLLLYRRDPKLARYTLLYNGLGAAYFLATLMGNVYQAPAEPVMSDMVVLVLSIIAGGALARRYGEPWYFAASIVGILALLAAATTWP